MTDRNEGRSVQTVGERLKEARKARKLTQAQLAKMAKIAQGTISDLEVGRNQSSAHLPMLGALLGVSSLWLQTGKGVREAEAAVAPVAPQRQINTALMVECWRAAESYTLRTGSNLTSEESLQLACRLYEQHVDTPKKAHELLAYLMTLTQLIGTAPKR